MLKLTEQHMASPKIDDLDRPVWGAAAIAGIIEKTEAQTLYLLSRGKLSATKIGGRWTSTPRRLLGQFAGPTPNAAA
jgi:hypothetical protein